MIKIYIFINFVIYFLRIGHIYFLYMIHNNDFSTNHFVYYDYFAL